MEVEVICNIRKNALAVTLVFDPRINRAFTLPETDVRLIAVSSRRFLTVCRQGRSGNRSWPLIESGLPCNRFYAAIGRPVVCTTGKNAIMA
jgi:hypothetical protein